MRDYRAKPNIPRHNAFPAKAGIHATRELRDRAQFPPRLYDRLAPMQGAFVI